MRRLAEAMDVSDASATGIVDRMEKRGLVERRNRPDDARSWGLYLTRRGESRLRELNRRVRANDAAFAARLAPRERQTLKKLLDKLSG